jgi:hypothetical protein
VPGSQLETWTCPFDIGWPQERAGFTRRAIEPLGSEVSVFAKKLLAVSVAVAVVATLIALYVALWAKDFPRTVAAAATSAGGGVDLTLETVAAVGKKLSTQHPDWVSYLVRSNGRWVRSTVFNVPANSVVHVTIYQFDTPTGLRNPFLSQVQGTLGDTATLDAKSFRSIPPEEASHTFAVPELGVFVPLAGVPEEAKNQCEEAPCELAMAHRTITFSFRTGAPGRYRWQCFVPCAAGWLLGNGGPMQTVGYMDGFIDVA